MRAGKNLPYKERFSAHSRTLGFRVTIGCSLKSPDCSDILVMYLLSIQLISAIEALTNYYASG